VPVATETVAPVHRPEELLRRPGPVVFEEEVAPPGLVTAGGLVVAEIEEGVVIQPGVMAWVGIEVTDVRAVVERLTSNIRRPPIEL
jgi:hypothetical protein